MKWKYKEPLRDEKVFDYIEQKYDRNVSDNLRKLVNEANGATPIQYKIMIGKRECVLAGILSFNQEENNSDNVFTALEVIDDKKLMPFAIDPFGNYFCLKRFDAVVFWDHETGKTTPAKKDLKVFIESLY